MSPTESAVLEYWKEHREQLRQSENQRAVLTNYVLVVTAGLSGFVAQQKFAMTTLPVCVLISVLGLYGALSTAKYHERANYHLTQARALTRTLSSMGVLGSQSELDNARQLHRARFPRLYRIRLHMIWSGLHLGVAGFGVGLASLCLINA